MSTKKVLILFIFITILTGTIVLATTGTIINAQSGLILRKEASKSGEVITTIPNGTELEIIEKAGEWYKVKYNNQEGYVFAEFIQEKVEPIVEEISEQTSNIPITQETNTTTKSETNIYIIPQITSTIIGTIPQNTQITIEKEVGKWLYIRTASLSGWVRTYRVNNETQEQSTETPIETPIETPAITVTEIPEKGYINVDSANVREQPSTDSKILTTLILNTGVKITEQTGNWYKINYQDQYIGYISKDLISVTQTTN